MATVITPRILFRRVFLLRPKYYSNAAFAPKRNSLSAGNVYGNNFNFKSLCDCNRLVYVAQQKCVFSTEPSDKAPCEMKPEKMSIFQRFKQMYRDYWYVLVPVHLVTSACWFGGFYYLSKSGIDVVAFLESMNFSEKITNPLKDSSMGYIAISYALYKIATPIRYTVTLGGTTLSINYLKKWGYIKPVPSRDKLKELYKHKKETLIYNMKDKSDELKLKREQLKDQTDQLITKLKDSKGAICAEVGKEMKK